LFLWHENVPSVLFFVRSFVQDWVVYTEPPFGGPQHVLHYLARYTHRVAISNHRIVAFADGQVTFRWKDMRMAASRN
jgi:Putative transposase